VDDLPDESEAGTAGIFETELTSGLFYGYVVVDVPALVANLGMTVLWRDGWSSTCCI
jgi:CRISPR system Cascade subunit CasC